MILISVFSKMTQWNESDPEDCTLFNKNDFILQAPPEKKKDLWEAVLIKGIDLIFLAKVSRTLPVNRQILPPSGALRPTALER